MKKLDIENLNNLPFHDVDFLYFIVEQDNKGNADLKLGIQFSKDELPEIEDSLVKYIKNDGKAFLVLKNCSLINLNMISNSTKRDEIDFIKVNNETDKLINLGIQKLEYKHIEIVFISGSIIKCIFKEIMLSSV